MTHRFLLLPLLAILAACTIQVDKPAIIARAEKVAVEKAARIKVIEDSLSWANLEAQMNIERRQLAIEGLQKILTVLPDTGSREERLCSKYLQNFGFSSALELPDDIWRKSGVEKKKVVAAYQAAAISFARDIGKIIVLPIAHREKLERGWSHTCDGLLRPTDATLLVIAMTRQLKDSEAPRPSLNPEVERVVLKTYRGLLSPGEGMTPEGWMVRDSQYWGAQK